MQTEAFGFKSSLGLSGSERVSERGASLLAPVCAPQVLLVLEQGAAWAGVSVEFRRC